MNTRVMPLAPGWWWCRIDGLQPRCVAVNRFSHGLCIYFAGTRVPIDDDSLEWVAPVPGPEESVRLAEVGR